MNGNGKREMVITLKYSILNQMILLSQIFVSKLIFLQNVACYEIFIEVIQISGG